MKFYPTPAIYNSSENWRDTLNGADPAGLVDAGGIAEIIDSIDGHKKVLQVLQDGNLCTYAFANQVTGTIEFWIRAVDCTPATCFTVCDAGFANGLNFLIASDVFAYVSAAAPAGAGIGGAPAPADNTWYHAAIVFDLGTPTWRVEIDGTNYAVGNQFNGAPAAMDRILIWDYTLGADQLSYFDALDLSWESEYIYNRSRRPFENVINKYMSKSVLRTLEDIV